MLTMAAAILLAAPMPALAQAGDRACLIGFLDQSSKFLAPVYVGDTLYGTLIIDEVKPGRTTGVVGMRTTVHNQNRKLVLEGTQRYLLRKRPAPTVA